MRPLFSGDERLGHGSNPHAPEHARITIFPPKRGTAEADACFGGKHERRKPSNPYMHRNDEAGIAQARKDGGGSSLLKKAAADADFSKDTKTRK
ncbi:hypothetical protein M8494_23290 [Serratia ureilytica]